MPYLKLNTNVSLASSSSSELAAELSRQVTQITGKPERYVMIEVNTDKIMRFAGNTEPLAYLECKSIGLSQIQAKSLSASITQLLTEKLAIDGDRVYIEFSNCAPEWWGWNGSTFG